MDYLKCAIIIGALSAILAIIASGRLIALLLDLVAAYEEAKNDDLGVVTVLAITCVELVYSMQMAVLSVLVIVGAAQRNARMVTPWLHWTAAGIVVSIIYVTSTGEIWRILYIVCYAVMWWCIHAPMRDGAWQIATDDDSSSGKTSEIEIKVINCPKLNPQELSPTGIIV